MLVRLYICFIFFIVIFRVMCVNLLCECAMVCRPCLLCNFCVYECNISAFISLIFVVRGMYGYYFLLGVVLGILLGEVDELELPFHPLLIEITFDRLVGRSTHPSAALTWATTIC